MTYELPEKLVPSVRVGDCVCFDINDLGLAGMPISGAQQWMCELIDGLGKRGLRVIHIESGVYCEVLAGAQLEEPVSGRPATTPEQKGGTREKKDD